MALVHMVQSVTEYFEYANASPDIINMCNNKDVFQKTIQGSTFHGNHENVHNKFINHKVKDEAARLGSAVEGINSIDFDTIKWEFKRRLEEGDEVDVDRYLAGQERCWNGVRRARKNKKVIRIFTAYGGNCTRSKDEIAINGAIAVTLCEILESLGIGVELWAATYTRGLGSNGDDLLECIKVKNADEFADLGIINYITGNNHVFRNICFRSWCRFFDENKLDTEYSLGRHGDITIDMFDDKESGNYDGTIIIPSIYDIQSAREWVMKTLKERITK